MGPRPGGRPAFLAAPMPCMGWKRPAAGAEIPAPLCARARGDPRSHAHTTDDAGHLSDLYEVAIPMATLCDPALMPVKVCEEPAGLGAYRESQMPAAERAAREAARNQYLAFIDWSCEHYQRVSVRHARVEPPDGFNDLANIADNFRGDV